MSARIGNRPMAFDSAYPGSMHQRLDGEYVLRDDVDSLLKALAEATAQRDREIENLKDSKDASISELLEALTDLVRANEQWNESVAAVVGRPANWSDSYLDNARAAIAKAIGANHD